MQRDVLRKTAKDLGVKRASDQSDAQLRDACKLAAAGATVLAPDSAGRGGDLKHASAQPWARTVWQVLLYRRL